MATLLAERLNGWKAIAAFLKVDVRTARRWEAERALPVHRLPGDSRSPVWADAKQLGDWLRGQPSPEAPLPEARAVPGPPPALPDRKARRRRPLLASIAVVAAIAIAGGGLALALAPATRLSAPAATYTDPAAQRRHQEALYALASRTPEGLDQAASLFAANARAEPANPAAFTGLAETMLLMREFAGLSDEAAYRRARDSAEHALALAPDDPAATRALAFALFWSEADKPRGLALFAEAARLAPADARTRHWWGNALVFSGRHAEGLAELARARALAPESSAIAADEAHIRFLLAETPETRANALASLRRVTEVDPDYIGAWRYLEWDLLAAGDAAGFLQAGRAHARLAGREDALAVARLQALAGNRAEAARWIARAQALGEPHAFMLEGWPELRPLMQDPAFAAQFRGPAPSRPLPPAQTPSR